MYKLCINVDTTANLAALTDKEDTDIFRRFPKCN